MVGCQQVLPQKIIEGLKTKADMIRALDGAGMSRADIARFMRISYQHVRNTLVARSTSSHVDVPLTPMQPIHHEPWPIQRLIDAGFQMLAECSLSDNGGFEYTAKAPSRPGVYIFAVDGWVNYVGLTRGTLRTRLGHYVYGHQGQRTSARVKELILDSLRAGSRVEVLIASPPDMEWNGLPIDGAAGLETGLIRLIKPAWNQQGSK